MSGSNPTPRDVAVEVVGVLQKAGHVTYLAGGCVRDALLGLDPKDFDVATDAHPKRVCELFKRSWYVGESFGVVRVQMTDCGQAIEVATFRSEGGYQDGRRPSEIHYQNGTVVQLANELGIHVPLNKFVYHSILPMEMKARKKTRIEN